ncbi:MAG: T9SS type A sorting domain-containing protein [bacterium]
MFVLSLLLSTAWTIEIVATEKITYPPTIALDSGANPYILVSKYRGSSGALALYYLFLYAKVNGNWTVDTFETCCHVMYPPDLAIDTRNRIWCIYAVVDTINPVMYLIVAHKDSTGWIKDTVESSTQLDFYSYSITTDSLDIPHIIYDLESAGFAYYAIRTDSGWMKTIIDTNYYYGNYSGMSIAFRKECYVSYMRFIPNGSGELWYAKKVDSIWVKEMLDRLFADFLLSFSSIAIGPNDFAGIVYLQQHPLGENGIVQYAYYDGTFWHIDTVDALSGINNQRVLDIDSLGKPYILYGHHEWPSRPKNKIAYKDSLGWHREILPFTPTTTWGWVGSLRVGGENLIHIACHATDDSQSVHEVHYIYGTPEGVEEGERLKVEGERLKLMVLPNVVKDNARIQFAIPKRQKIRLDLYDIIGRRLKTIADGTFESGVYKQNFTTSNLGSGVYFLILDGNKETKKTKILIMR